MKRRGALTILLVGLGVVVVLGYFQRWRWTGLSSGSAADVGYKTAWDWLDLLIVPVALAALGFWFNRLEKRAERQFTETVGRSQALQSYLDRMSELILSSKLPVSVEESPERAVARSRTLTALTQLDGEGRGVVLQFLYEANLIGFLRLVDHETGRQEQVPATVSLLAADFRYAKADGIQLDGADLMGVNLNGASMRGASLNGARLENAKLRGVDLRSGPPLYAADFTISPSLIGTNLRGADLTNATLDASLHGADLQYAKLNGAVLGRSRLAVASLRGAEFEGADLRDVEQLDLHQLALADTLRGATLPGGAKGRLRHKMSLEVDTNVYMSNTGKKARIVAHAFASLNLVPAVDSGYVVGVYLTFGHEENGTRVLGLLFSSLESGEQYVARSDSVEFALDASVHTEAVGRFDVHVQSPDATKRDSAQLVFRLILDSTGAVLSASIGSGGVTDVDSLAVL